MTAGMTMAGAAMTSAAEKASQPLSTLAYSYEQCVGVR